MPDGWLFKVAAQAVHGLYGGGQMSSLPDLEHGLCELRALSKDLGTFALDSAHGVALGRPWAAWSALDTSNVEQKVHHVAILDNIFFAL